MKLFGTAYLGLQEHPEYLEVVKKNIEQYGINNPISRNNAAQFEILEEVESTLVNEWRAETEQVPQFNLSDEIRNFLIDAFSTLPRNRHFISDTARDHPDNYAKFLIFGDKPNTVIPNSLQITKKIGQAYGFLSDIAYIKDVSTGKEFALSAVIFVNDNLTFNDNVYEYDTIGLPFMGALGRTLLEYD